MNSISNLSIVTENLFPKQTITQEQAVECFIHHFKTLITPFYERLSLIKEGKTLEAVSLKPSGIWYGNTYALALHSLGDELIPVRNEKTPANTIYNTLKNKLAFYKPFGPATYWENIPDETSEVKIKFHQIKIKNRVSPTEACQSFAKQLSFLDCYQIVSLACALTAIELLGKEIFDSHIRAQNIDFLGFASEATVINGDLSRSFTEPVHPWNPESIDAECSHLKRGQTFYMYNSSLYTEKHLHGEAAGINLIYLGNNLFTGFGLPPEGLSLRNIELLLLQEYNRDPIAAEILLPERFAELMKPKCIMQIQGKNIPITRKAAEEMLAGTSPFLHPAITKKNLEEQILPSIKQGEEKIRAFSRHRLSETAFCTNKQERFNLNPNIGYQIISAKALQTILLHYTPKDVYCL